jgi:hypothetical protein
VLGRGRKRGGDLDGMGRLRVVKFFGGAGSVFGEVSVKVLQLFSNE